MRPGRLVAAAILTATAAAVMFAPLLAPHDAEAQYADFPYAPPMPLRLAADDGVSHQPFVYPIQLVDRLNRRYVEDRSRAIPLSAVWRRDGDGRVDHPVFLLGADALGRDVLSRLLLGARTSMGIAAAATVGALVVGILIGGLAGYAGGLLDAAAMRLAEVILVLPMLYIVLALRTTLPLVLDPHEVFVGVTTVLTLVGWPAVARGVRAIVAAECSLDYVEAARACGASPARIVLRHVVPAARPFIATQAALLVSAFAIAEATLSFAGFGFAEPTPSWGTMLQEAANVTTLGECPWLLAPALMIAAVSWALHSLVDTEHIDRPVSDLWPVRLTRMRVIAVDSMAARSRSSVGAPLDSPAALQERLRATSSG